jgi:DNA-binding NtrC family response regulator
VPPASTTTVRRTSGYRGRAAKLLRISRSTLYRYLQSHERHSGTGGDDAENDRE